jgi:hypothetical protein
MGWLFSCDRNFGKQDQIAKFREPSYWGEGVKRLADRVVGNHYWAAIELASGRKLVFLALLQGGGKDSGWGYKDMYETMGPCYYDCPLSLLAMTGEPTEGYAVGWRAKVRAHHAAKKARPEYESGMRVQYGDHEYRLHTPAGPRKGWNVVRCGDGALFRMRAKQLAASTVKESK